MWARFGLFFVVLHSFLSQCTAAVGNGSDVPSNGFGMRFRLPFTDMDIQSVSNVRIIKDASGQEMFLLHGAEFYRLILGREVKRLTLIATLGGDVKETELLDAEIISWRDYVLLVVVIEEHLEVYQFAKKTILERTASPVNESMAPFEMDPIQQITLNGRYRKIILCDSSSQGGVTLIVLVNFTKLYSRLNTYEWAETYFDPSEEKTIAPVQDLQLIGSRNKYLVLSRESKKQNEVTVIVYSVLPSSLKQVQAMQLQSMSVNPFTYQGINYMLSCTAGQKMCTSFKMRDGQFVVYKNRPSGEFDFSLFTAGEHFLVGQRATEVSVYVDSRMECYGTIKTNNSDVTSILTHLNEKGSDFILLNYIRPNSALVRIIEIEYEQVAVPHHEDVDEVGAVLKHQRHALEESIQTLRKTLLGRKRSFDQIKKSIGKIASKARDLVSSLPIHILSGQIGIVKLIGSKLRSPMQILERITALSKGERKARFSRGFAEDQPRNSSLDLKVRKLRVGNLIHDGDLIPGFSLSSDGTHLKIGVHVTTRILDTKELLTATVMASKRSKRSDGRSNVEVRKLRVNRINGVAWEDFHRNLFLRSRDRAVSGRLILQSNVEVEDLKTVILNGLPAKKILNLVDVQNITSDIVISRFFVNDLTADQLNGLDFARDIARKGVENFILSPVVAQDVAITGKLILSEKDHQARHVFGTNVLDFQQAYTGRVVIEGSLTLVNLHAEDSFVFMDDKAINADIASSFWMYSLPQTFDGPVAFIDSEVSAASLSTHYLNKRHLSKYLRTTDQQSPSPLLLIFLSAHIEGSLTADPAFGTKLRGMDRNALKLGDRMIVSGEKFFQGSLMVDHGQVTHFNDLPASDLVSVNEKICEFTGKKSFKSIHIRNEALIKQNLDLKHLNSAPQFDDLFKTTSRFSTVVLRSPLRAKNVVFNYLNGFSSTKLFSSIRSFDDKLVLHKDLYIEGTIHFQSNLAVDTINSIVWDEYLHTLVRSNENTVIRGNKTIANTLTISTELKTPSINDVAIDDLFKNVLLKSHDQIISGAYTFNTARLSNIDVPYVNELPTSAFIDTRSPEVIFNCDMVMPKLKVRGSLYALHDIDFHSLEQRVKASTVKPWKNLYVTGNARWPWGIDQQSLNLQYLFENAVRHRDDQVITGSVRLKKPLVNTMITKQIFPPDIDFDYIAGDCLFHNSSTQEVVMASKVFLRTVQIAEVISRSHLGCKVVNRVDVLALNSTLYRVSEPTILHEPLTFQIPPIFGHISVEGAINGMQPNRIFLAYEGKSWPSVKLHSLFVANDLTLLDVDQMSLDFLLKNRIRLSGPAQEVFGHLTFEQLVLEKEIYMQSINGIPIESVVQKTSETLQEISAPKTILGDLKLHGPAMVVRLNNEDVIDRYRKTILLDQDYHFESLSIENAKFKDGVVIKTSFFKQPIHGAPQDTYHKENLHEHARTLKEIEANLRVAEEIVETTATNPRRLVYLDYDFSTIIEWKSTNDSIQEQFTFDKNRYQYCDREQTIVKWSKYHNRIFLSKLITNTITAEEYGIQVTADNTCKDSYRNTNSLISITDGHFAKRFTIDKLVQSIEIYYGDDVYVLIHAIDLYAGENEIRTFRIDSNTQTIHDWQLLTAGVGKVSRLFRLETHTILVVSTIIDNYPSITIYKLNAKSHVFEVIQVIDGDFDVIELAQVTPQRYHLFLGCIHCQRIVIFEYDSLSSDAEDCLTYHIYQIIKLKTRIDRFNLFTLPDGDIYLLVLSDQDIDFYHVYKYRYIEGWKHFTYGYFKNIQNTYPLLSDGLSSIDDNLLLLCNRKCTLVKSFYQG